MEAVAINVHSKDIATFFTAINITTFQRNKLEKDRTPKKDFENTKNYYSKTNLNLRAYNLKNKDGKKEYIFKIDEKEININANEFSYEIKKVDNIYFIDNFGFDNFWLKDAYISIQKMDKEDTLNNYINQFDSNIEKFKIFDDSPECKVRNLKKYQKINEFGSGLKSYISIICSLYACENGYLFIDEVDNGIHYTQLDKLWEIILTISKQQNVQVFATTHSKECIESYARVAKKLEDKEIAFIELGRDNDNKITSIIYEYDEIINQVEQHQEIRGW